MAGISLTVKLLGAKKLIDTLKSKDTISKPVESGIKRTVLYYERITKKLTPVLFGHLRSSITSKIAPTHGIVGTNVNYASYIEYGHKQEVGRYVPAIGKRLVQPFVPARHVFGGSRRIKGKGPFTRALELLHTWLDKGEHKIHAEIDERFQ